MADKTTDTIIKLNQQIKTITSEIDTATAKIQTQSQNIANAISDSFSKISNNKLIIGSGNAMQITATNFIKASGLIATAVTQLGTSAATLMNDIANEDLAIEKLANKMNISKQAASQMKNALDALGESMQDIENTPELQDRYNALVADGAQMQLGGDYDITMKGFRDLMFEATRFKQEAGYAMQQVAYHLMKNLSEPLSHAKTAFRFLNDMIVANMPTIASAIAQAISAVINIARPLWELLKLLGASLYHGWDTFAVYLNDIKDSIQTLWSALTEFGNSALTSVTTLLKNLFDAFANQQTTSSFKDLLSQLADIFKEVSSIVSTSLNIFAQWLDQAAQSDVVKNLFAAVAQLGGTFATLLSTIYELVYVVLKDLFSEFASSDGLLSFTDLLAFVIEVVTIAIGIISSLIEITVGLFNALKNSAAFNIFLENISKLIKGIYNTISMVGTLGRALLALLKGEFVMAYKIAKQAFGGTDETTLPDALVNNANIAGLLTKTPPSNSYISSNNNSRTTTNSTNIDKIYVSANNPQEFTNALSSYLPLSSGLNGSLVP